MLMNSPLRIVLFFSFVVAPTVQAMVYDNRYFPLYLRPYSRITCKQSSFFGDGMIMTSGGAIGKDDEDTTIPGIFGQFDEQALAKALVRLGYPNYLPDIDSDLPWRIKGKLQAQGLAFEWNQHIQGYWSVGASWFFMHVLSRQLFKPIGATALLDPFALEFVDEQRRAMFKVIGITATTWNKTGMSDTDLYIRFGNVWDYPTKFRRIDAGVKFGVMAPTGVKRDINNPASVPFGGNGLWGVYVSADGEFEAKEDWSVGILARVSQRFSKTQEDRFSVRQPEPEQQLYGALVGLVDIDPGVSYAFAPYLRIEDLREGLGFLVGYTIAGHLQDSYTDKRPVQAVQGSMDQLGQYSDWAQEYMTFNLYYDFSKIKNDNVCKPTISFMWDLPVHYMVAHDVPKTNRISVGIEFDF